MSTTVMGIISAAIVLMIGLALLPTLLEKVNDIDQQTRAHCEYQGAYFTEAHTDSEWANGTRYSVIAGSSDGCALQDAAKSADNTAAIAAIQVYAPNGSQLPTIPSVSDPDAVDASDNATRAANPALVTAASGFKNESGNDGWHTVVGVVAEQASLMRLVAGVLPVVGVIGVLGAGAMLFRGAMLRRGAG